MQHIFSKITKTALVAVFAMLTCNVSADEEFAVEYPVGSGSFHTLNFKINTGSGTAALVQKQSGSTHENYSGDVYVPAQIIIGVDTYTVDSIGENAFANRKGGQTSEVTSVILPFTIKGMHHAAFRYCTNIRSFSIDETDGECQAYKVDDNGILYSKDGSKLIAFPSGNEELTSFESNVTSLSGHAFTDCTHLETITLPNITVLPDGCFARCTALTTLNATNVEYIENSALKEASNLTDVTFPNLKSLKAEAFWKSHITSITIPKEVTVIPEKCFGDCSYLESVEFEDESQVVTIDKNAFQRCTSLTSISIPKHVTSIGEGAFDGCSALASVSFESPSLVTSIGSKAFQNTARLTSIVLPANLQSIGDNAFYHSGLTSVSITSKAKVALGSNAFMVESMTSGDDVPSSATLNVPCGQLDTYKNDEAWSDQFDVNNIVATVQVPYTLSVFYNDTKIADRQVDCESDLSDILNSYLPDNCDTIYKYDEYIKYDFSGSQWEDAEGNPLISAVAGPSMPADDYSVYLRSTTERKYPIQFQVSSGVPALKYIYLTNVTYDEAIRSKEPSESDLTTEDGSSSYSVPACTYLSWLYDDKPATIMNHVQAIRDDNEADKKGRIDALMSTPVVSQFIIDAAENDASYVIRYVVEYPEEVNGETEEVVFTSDSILRNTSIPAGYLSQTAPAAPEGECWAFQGWGLSTFERYKSESSDEYLMPCNDIEIRGEFSGTFRLTLVPTIEKTTNTTIAIWYQEAGLGDWAHADGNYKDFSCGETISLPGIFVQGGNCYTQDGYEYSTDNSNWSTFDGKMPSANISVRPAVIAKKYKISFLVDGETDKYSDIIDIDCHSVVPDLPELDLDKYTEWELASGETVPDLMPEHDITLVTYSKHNIIFNLNVVNPQTGDPETINVRTDEGSIFGQNIDFPTDDDVQSKLDFSPSCYDLDEVSEWVADNGNTYTEVPNYADDITFIKTINLKSYQLSFADVEGVNYGSTTQPITCSGAITLPTSVTITDQCLENPNTDDSWSWEYIKESDLNPTGTAVPEGNPWDNAQSLGTSWPDGVYENIIARPVVQRRALQITFKIDGKDYTPESPVTFNCGEEIDETQLPNLNALADCSDCYTDWKDMPQDGLMPKEGLTLTAKSKHKVTYTIYTQIYYKEQLEEAVQEGETLSLVRNYGDQIPTMTLADFGISNENGCYTEGGWLTSSGEDQPETVPSNYNGELNKPAEINLNKALTINAYDIVFKADENEISRIVKKNCGSEVLLWNSLPSEEELENTIEPINGCRLKTFKDQKWYVGDAEVTESYNVKIQDSDIEVKISSTQAYGNLVFCVDVDGDGFYRERTSDERWSIQIPKGQNISEYLEANPEVVPDEVIQKMNPCLEFKNEKWTLGNNDQIPADATMCADDYWVFHMSQTKTTTVTFRAEGLDDIIKEDFCGSTLPAIDDPTAPAGKHFVEWSGLAALNGVFPSEDVTIVAIFEDNSKADVHYYVIDENNNHITSLESNDSYVIGLTFNIKNLPTDNTGCSGYTGWKHTNDKNAEDITETSLAMIEGGIDLYAFQKKQQFTVQYSGNEGISIKKRSAQFECEQDFRPTSDDLEFDDCLNQSTLAWECKLPTDDKWKELTVYTMSPELDGIMIRPVAKKKQFKVYFYTINNEGADPELQTSLTQTVDCGTSLADVIKDKVPTEPQNSCLTFADQTWKLNGADIHDQKVETDNIMLQMTAVSKDATLIYKRYKSDTEPFATIHGKCGDKLPTADQINGGELPQSDDPGQSFDKWDYKGYEVMPAGELTVVAVFKDNEQHNVIFNFIDSESGQTYADAQSKSFREGDNVELIAAFVNTQCDTYSAWSTKDEEGHYVALDGMLTMGKSDINLYSLRTRTTFTVTFDSDIEGLKSITFNDGKDGLSRTYNCGATVVYPTVVTQDCYEFKYWEYKFATDDEWKHDGQPTTVTADYDGLHIRPVLNEKPGGTVTYYYNNQQYDDVETIACGALVGLKALPTLGDCESFTTATWVDAVGNPLPDNKTIVSGEQLKLYLVSQTASYTVHFQVPSLEIPDLTLQCNAEGQYIQEPDLSQQLNEGQYVDWNWNFDTDVVGPDTEGLQDGILTITGRLSDTYSLTVYAVAPDDAENVPAWSPFLQTYDIAFGQSFAEKLQGFEIQGYGLSWTLIGEHGMDEENTNINSMPAHRVVAIASYDKPEVETVQLCRTQLPYCWRGLEYNETGVYPYYNDNLKHLYLLDLVVLPNDTITSTYSACDSFEWHGAKYEKSGTYYWTTNCGSTKEGYGDLVDKLILTINSSKSSDTTATICGDRFVWYGKTFERGTVYAEEEYKHTLTTTTGCDSIINLSLIFSDVQPERQMTMTACTENGLDEEFNVIQVYRYTRYDGTVQEIRRTNLSLPNETFTIVDYEPAAEGQTCDTKVVITLTLTSDGFVHKVVPNYTMPKGEVQMGVFDTIQQPTCDNGNEWIIQVRENPGYHFTQWDDSTTVNPRTIRVISDTVIVANFVKAKPISETHNITFGTMNANLGEVEAWIDLTAIPFEERYVFDYWTEYSLTDGQWYRRNDESDNIIVELNRPEGQRDIRITAHFKDTFKPVDTGDKGDGNTDGRGIDVKPRDPNNTIFIPAGKDRPTLLGNPSDNVADGLDETPIEGTLFVGDNTITVIGHEGFDMQVYSAVGQLIYDGRIASHTTVVNVPPHNVYLVRIGTQTAKVIVK